MRGYEKVPNSLVPWGFTTLLWYLDLLCRIQLVELGSVRPTGSLRLGNENTRVVPRNCTIATKQPTKW